MKSGSSSILFLGLILLLLEAGSRVGIYPPYLIPAPSEIFRSILDHPYEYFQATLSTFTNAFLGLFLSTVFGSFLALSFSLSPLLKDSILPFAIFFQTVPIVSIAPVLVIWFGFGSPTVIASAFICSLFPIIANTLLGLEQVDRNLFQLFQLYRASRLKILFLLRIPGARSQFFTGLQIAAGLAVIGAIVGEFVAGGGLGAIVDASRTQNRIEKVFAAVLLSALLGAVFVEGIRMIKNKWIIHCWMIILFGFSMVTPFRSEAKTIQLILNWKAEPEFGGFFEAELAGYYKAENLNIKIIEGGSGTPTTQIIANNKAEFGVAGGEEVPLAIDRGAPIVSLFAVYQINPLGLMTRSSRKEIQSLEELWKSEGFIALQLGLPFVDYLKNKWGNPKAKLVPYNGGISSYLAHPKFSQQCFVTAEPLDAEEQGVSTKSFLIADTGFNPYSTVVIANRKWLDQNLETTKAFLKATQKGWESYLKNPARANEYMAKLNPSMSLKTFNRISKAQIPYIVTEETRKNGIGTMSDKRWKELAETLYRLKLIRKVKEPTEYYRLF